MIAIQNARHLGSPVDILIDGEKIVTMLPSGKHDLPEHCDVFDARGFILMPSLCDCHAHFREPGQEYKEDINSGLESAAHGGFGAVMCMANTRPVNDEAAVTSFMLDRARLSHPHGPNLYPVAAATKNLDGKELAPLAELAKAGCIAVSNDGKPLGNTEMVRRVMEYAADLNLRFIDHCEDPWLAKGWAMHEGRVSGDIGVKGQPGCGEAIQVARDILLAEYLDIPVHIAHVSSKTSVDLIKWGKERGVKVTAETCPHYLLLDDGALTDYNPNAKMSPPLRSSEDKHALREAIKSGVIDILVTDHAPHARHEKEVTLDMAPCGVIGLDLALPLTFQLVDEGVITESDLHRLWLKRPAEIFGLPCNNFNPGDDADFFLYDPQKEWQVTETTLYSKSSNTPFLGQIIKGKVMRHWMKGRQLF